MYQISLRSKKKISIQEKGKAFIFKLAFAACYLANKTFAVADAINTCLYFIDCDGNIHTKLSYTESGSFGTIDYDENNFKLLVKV